MLEWKQSERPEDEVLRAYRLAHPYKHFRSAIEFGTNRPLGRQLVKVDGVFETTSEPILGIGKPPIGRFELAIALHVLEHCRDAKAAVADLWAHTNYMLLVEVPAIEVDTYNQGYDDINPGHFHHFSMGELIQLIGGTVMDAEGVRVGPWPCNRVLARRGEPSMENKISETDRAYRMMAARIKLHVRPGDAYLGDGYSLKRLLELGAPALPAYDTFKHPVPRKFTSRLILTPRYLPTRTEMASMYERRTLDLWP